MGGSSRKAGKTTVICEIIAATREAEWTAIKISPHDHEPSLHGDTERYLDAGAARASILQEYPADTYSGNIIVESNRVMEIPRRICSSSWTVVANGSHRRLGMPRRHSTQ